MEIQNKGHDKETQRRSTYKNESRLNLDLVLLSKLGKEERLPDTSHGSWLLLSILKLWLVIQSDSPYLILFQNL